MSIIKKTLLPIIISATSVSFLHAEAPVSDWQSLMKQFRQTELNKFDSSENLKALQDYLSRHPENALAQLYVGSSHCMVGRDAWMPWNKIDAVNVCIDKMEIAYLNAQKQYTENSPERLNADLLLGLTSAGLPDRFKQQQITIDTLAHAVQHPYFSQQPEYLRTQTTQTLADFKKK